MHHSERCEGNKLTEQGLQTNQAAHKVIKVNGEFRVAVAGHCDLVQGIIEREPCEWREGWGGREGQREREREREREGQRGERDRERGRGGERGKEGEGVIEREGERGRETEREGREGEREGGRKRERGGGRGKAGGPDCAGFRFHLTFHSQVRPERPGQHTPQPPD
ncbi:hypothetical protein JZ751_006375 [Albula glossodonta]|uniref:Uncharacterized protein n=1 Tax=Albula glossodonta TaxID=121402 RepID=A0A8T2N369_9TELE|nr:hypothetical protein JZ751_006375 [Albula glossodonta]